MPHLSRHPAAAAAIVGLVVTAALPAARQSPDEAALATRARAIHDRVITLDTHADIEVADFTPARNYTQRLTTQVNLPKMLDGGLDAAFLIVYTAQGPLTPQGYANAYEAASAKFDAIHRLAREIAPEQIELALSAADVRRIAASGKKVALIGVENGYPIGTDLTRIQEFYDRGARYLSLAHNGHNQLSDSNTGERDGVWLHNGLSELGRAAIAELNRLGIMVDVSHPSKASMMQTVALSRAPVIASHSAARALANHSRNLDDEQLLALRKNGGVIQTVAFSSYLKASTPAASERATVADLVDHIDYLVKLIGIDHVGISSDFDGGGGVVGWSDASETFNLTLELVRRGYTEEQIGKLWSGNVLRVMDDVRRAARR